MSNTNVAKIGSKLPALQMSEDELMSVLQTSLYVGAQVSSIKMAVNYCKAAGLDIMQKPVHLVPMWDSKNNTMRDVVMAGIGLYRTQASRSGEMAGITEPEYGEDVTEQIGGVQITYPKWCRVTVKRTLPNGGVAEFVAVERWIENYAAKGGKEKSQAPNTMWAKRPYAQLAKCAEAQALRKAFPELGAMPTAEEMEGKEIDVTPTSAASAEPPMLDDASFKSIADKYKKSIVEGKKTFDDFVHWVESKGAKLTEEQKKEVKSWVKKEPAVVEGEATKVDDDFVNDMNKEEGKTE
jgi:phage recombination protein Bet